VGSVKRDRISVCFASSEVCDPFTGDDQAVSG
jgi:hypothetical protein